jgi:uncharacterized protein
LFSVIHYFTEFDREEDPTLNIQKVDKLSLLKLGSKKETSLEKVSFSEVMAKGREEKTIERLRELVSKIEDQGAILAESRTVEDLRKYKQLVKDFMDDAIKSGLQLEDRRGFTRRGKSKIYKIVEQVDKKIIELTDAVLVEQKSSLEILDLVGEIKGLLINVYA